MTPELLVAGRILLASYFVVSGVNHAFVFGPVSGLLAQRGVPFPKMALAAGSIFEVLAGLALAVGILVVPAAIGLIIFTLAASAMLLDFWNKQGPERATAINAILANIAVIGGLLLAITTA